MKIKNKAIIARLRQIQIIINLADNRMQDISDFVQCMLPRYMRMYKGATGDIYNMRIKMVSLIHTIDKGDGKDALDEARKLFNFIDKFNSREIFSSRCGELAEAVRAFKVFRPLESIIDSLLERVPDMMYVTVQLIEKEVTPPMLYKRLSSFKGRTGMRVGGVGRRGKCSAGGR